MSSRDVLTAIPNILYNWACKHRFGLQITIIQSTCSNGIAVV